MKSFKIKMNSYEFGDNFQLANTYVFIGDNDILDCNN